MKIQIALRKPVSVTAHMVHHQYLVDAIGAGLFQCGIHVVF